MKEMYLKVDVEQNCGDWVDVFYRKGRNFTCSKDDKSLVEIEDAEEKGAERLYEAITAICFGDSDDVKGAFADGHLEPFVGMIDLAVQRHAGARDQLTEALILHADEHQPCQIVGCGEMLRRVQTVRVSKMRMRQSQSLRLLIHKPDKGLDTSRDMFCKGQGRIVAGCQKQAQH